MINSWRRFEMSRNKTHANGKKDRSELDYMGRVRSANGMEQSFYKTVAQDERYAIANGRNPDRLLRGYEVRLGRMAADVRRRRAAYAPKRSVT
jgi:hypothetical protein